MEITPKAAVDQIIISLKAKLVTMLTSSPGVGKSSIVYAIAKKFKLFVIDIRLSQCDIVDLNN